MHAASSFRHLAARPICSGYQSPNIGQSVLVIFYDVHVFSIYERRSEALAIAESVQSANQHPINMSIKVVVKNLVCCFSRWKRRNVSHDSTSI